VLVAIAVILGIGVVVFRPNPVDAALDVDPGSIDFPEHVLAVPGESRTITLTSAGDQALSIGTVQVEPPGDFVVRADSCSGATLPGGSQCTIDVAFQPGTVGEVTAVLVIPHSAEGGQARITLGGTGIRQPGGSPTPERVAAIDIDPKGSIDFEDRGQQKTLTILSIGAAPLELFEISLDPIEANDQFRLDTGACTSPLAQDSTCTVTITFVGNPEIVTTAILSIESNGSSEPLRITLSGIPRLAVTVGDVFLDEKDSRKKIVVTVANVGTAEFDISSVTTTDAEVFSVSDVDDCSNSTLLIGGQCTVILHVDAGCQETAFVARIDIENTTIENPVSRELRYENPCIVE
jgi:hypothetical protein